MTAYDGLEELHLIRRIPIVKEKTLENTLFGFSWEIMDTDLPGGSEFLGVSLHISGKQRSSFFQQLRENDRKEYGNDVPDTYYCPSDKFEVVAKQDFYRYAKESTGDSIKGIFIGIHNVKYVSRLNLIEPSEKIEGIIKNHGAGFVEELMTIKRLLKEISDDTRLWYEH